MFDRLSRFTAAHERDRLPLAEHGDESAEEVNSSSGDLAASSAQAAARARANATLFDDRRWISVAPTLMPAVDYAVYRSASISPNAVVGCCRHGVLELA